MRSNGKRSYTPARGAALALALSALLLAGCGSEPEASSSAPSSSAPSPSASRSTTAPASPTPSQPSAAPATTTAAVPAPVPPAPAQSAPLPAPLTAEDAQRIIADYHQNGSDLAYTVFDNGDGTFDVKVTSRSIAAQGGTGTTGLYVVEQSGRFALK